MKLPVRARALLVDRLVESLDITDPSELQRLWAAEALRRRGEIRSGQLKPIDGDEVLSEIRRASGR